MPMLTAPLPAAEPDSITDYVVDFASQVVGDPALSSAESTLSVRTTLTGYSSDLDPTSHLVGDPTVSGSIVTQRVSGLLAGNDYVLSVRGTLADGRVITLWGLLRCRDIGAPIIRLPGWQVGFDYLAWLATYPEFEGIDEASAYGYFVEAASLHANDGTLVADDVRQSYLMGLLTAHLAARYSASQPGSSSPIVGPIVSASEGSVSVSGQPIAAPGTQAWYLTTKYGSDYWVATAAFRTMHYRAAPPRIFDPFAATYRRGW